MHRWSYVRGGENSQSHNQRSGRPMARVNEEEDHDHDLPRCVGRCCRHHHWWILWTVNAKAREIHRHQQHRVPNSEPSAASAFTYIVPIREADCRTDERGSSLSKVPPRRASIVTPIARVFSLSRALPSSAPSKPKRGEIIIVIVVVVICVIVNVAIIVLIIVLVVVIVIVTRVRVTFVSKVSSDS